jgi:hypothetical protein
MKRAYSISRVDRCGSQVNEDIFVYAHCIQSNLDFAGPVGDNWFKEHTRLTELLNLPLPIKELTNARDLIKIEESDYSKEVYPNRNDLITPSFIDHLRERSLSNINYDASHKDPKVVLHIRRGDVSFHTHSHRYIPNSYFLNLVRNFIEISPSSDITIFSESNSSEPFDDFINLGCKVLLDTDLADIWKEMITCDVLFMSKSSFSYVPALYNKNFVVYYPAWYDKLNHWTSSEDPALWDKIRNYIVAKYEK